MTSSSPGVLKIGQVSKGATGVCSNSLPEVGAQKGPCGARPEVQLPRGLVIVSGAQGWLLTGHMQ